MKTYIIDTNALLSFVTDRSLEQQAAMTTLFNETADLNCKIKCHSHVITEFVYVLDKIYGHGKSAIRRMIKDLINMPGIEICNDINFRTLLDFWPSRISDFGDAVVASLWTDNRHASIVTFDKRFLRELNRIGAQVYANHP